VHCKLPPENLNGTTQVKDLRAEGRIILKRTKVERTGFMTQKKGQTIRSYELGNETAGSIRGEKSAEWSSDCYVLNKGSVLRSRRVQHRV
jgi:hypothetical protein